MAPITSSNKKCPCRSMPSPLRRETNSLSTLSGHKQDKEDTHRKWAAGDSVMQCQTQRILEGCPWCTVTEYMDHQNEPTPTEMTTSQCVTYDREIAGSETTLGLAILHDNHSMVFTCSSLKVRPHPPSV